MSQPSLVYIGIAGNVIALNDSDGQEIWRTALMGRDFVNVVLRNSSLYATAKGELFCLDPATGRIRWQNPLRGLGRGLITIATADGQQAIVMREKEQRDEAAAAATNAAIG